MVHFIAEELVRLGHCVTLYATAGSQTSAKLIECSPGNLRELGIRDGSQECVDTYTSQLRLALSGAHEPKHDIVHVHQGTYPFQLAVLEAAALAAATDDNDGAVPPPPPVVWTDHNAVHNDDKPALFRSMEKFGIGLTALSDSHRNTVPDANWLETVHHGLPANVLTPSPNAGPPTHLAFLGRISPEKGITTAVRIAEAGGFELKVAAKVDQVNRDFYEKEVKPLFEASEVDFIGEITELEKGPFLSTAIALIFPINWKEPFGLVMIEAMACGCPVVAFRVGSVEEIIEDGVTGFVVDTEEEAVEALKQIGELDRGRIRQRFEERFTSTTMALKYVEIYERVVQQAAVMRETREIAKSIVLPAMEERSVLPASREVVGVTPSFLPRPMASRQVSAYL